MCMIERVYRKNNRGKQLEEGEEGEEEEVGEEVEEGGPTSQTRK